MNKDIERVRHALKEADAVLIGASNGLSISEGYNIFACNDMFISQFGDFREQYGIQSVLQGCFAQYPGKRDFLERLVKLWIEGYTPSSVMKNLYSLVHDKSYFVLTTNADMHLEAAGFEADKVFEMEGTMLDMLHGRQPIDRREAFAKFMETNHGKRIVFLELGIGIRNQMIKAPMMQIAARETNAVYVAMNLAHELWVDSAIKSRAILLPGDIANTLSMLCGDE